MKHSSPRFNQRANSYDEYAQIQRITQAHLLEYVVASHNRHPRHILDIGCGTGNGIVALHHRFPEATIVGIDPAPNMIKCTQDKCKNIPAKLILSSLERLQMADGFDLIYSHAALHWTDATRSFLKLKALLSPDGTIAVSFFGPETFWELQTLVDFPIPATRFLDGESLYKIAKAVFPTIRIVQKKHALIYPNLLTLLKSIQKTGAVSGYNKNGLWTPKKLAVLEKDYLDSFGCIQATHQVFYLSY